MSRVFLSMTTIPERSTSLGPTLESLGMQTRLPNEVTLFLAPGSSLVGLADFPDRLSQRSGWTVHEFDRGPIDKLSILERLRSPRPDDIIVTIDDDIIYEPTWLETLVAAAEANPDHAIGFSGWNASGFINAWQKGRDDGDFVFPHIPGPCDVLEGWCGVAYRYKHFYIDSLQGFASVLHPLPMFKWVDDVWISWHLARRGVPRMLIGPRLAKPREDTTKGIHDRPDFVQMNREAAIVAFGEVGKT